MPWNHFHWLYARLENICIISNYTWRGTLKAISMKTRSWDWICQKTTKIEVKPKKLSNFKPEGSSPTWQQFFLFTLTIGQRHHHWENLRIKKHHWENLRKRTSKQENFILDCSHLIMTSKEGDGALEHRDPGLAAHVGHLVDLLVLGAESVDGDLWHCHQRVFRMRRHLPPPSHTYTYQ